MENNIITNKELYFHYTDELGISNKDAIVLLKLALAGFGKEINWKQIRDEFFEECTERVYPHRLNSCIKYVSLAPHDMFEWFKNKLS